MPEVNTSVSSRIYYRKMGTGPVAVLLHGFPESGTLWRNVWDYLSAYYTLLIPDMPGTGDSLLEGSAGIEDMATTVKTMLDAEHVEKAIVVGHSMGGYIAFAFAALFPQYVQGLSLIHSTPLADDDEKKQTRKKVIEIVDKGGKDLFLSQMVPGLFAEEFVKEHPNLVKEQVTNAQTMSKEGLMNFYTAMMNRKERINVLETATYPIQWIIGAKDALIPAQKLIGFSHTSAVNYVSYYKECGHISMVEAPKRLQTDLKYFFDNCYVE